MQNLEKKRADQISGGIFIIGLGVIFLADYFWPGILFVLGATSIAQGLAEGRGWYAFQGSIWLFGIGLLFATDNSDLIIPGILIMIGVSMLIGYIFRPPMLARGGGFDADEE